MLQKSVPLYRSDDEQELLAPIAYKGSTYLTQLRQVLRAGDQYRWVGSSHVTLKEVRNWVLRAHTHGVTKQQWEELYQNHSVVAKEKDLEHPVRYFSDYVRVDSDLELYLPEDLVLVDSKYRTTPIMVLVHGNAQPHPDILVRKVRLSTMQLLERAWDADCLFQLEMDLQHLHSKLDEKKMQLNVQQEQWALFAWGMVSEVHDAMDLLSKKMERHLKEASKMELD